MDHEEHAFQAEITMLVEQAVFTSTNAGHLRGYQLVARSKGINDRLAAELCRWSPSQGALQEDSEAAVSFNYFPISDDWFAVSRSTYGGPEYSRRGSLRVTTHILVLTASQFARFKWNAFNVARAAMTSGALFLELDVNALMQPIALPDRMLPRKLSSRISTQHQQVAVSAGSGQPVAVVGASAPEDFAAAVVEILPEENRSSTSFSTGLNLTEQRPFLVQFFPRADIRLENKLKRMEIKTVRCNGMPVA